MKIDLPQVSSNDVNMRFSSRLGAMPNRSVRRDAIPKSTRHSNVNPLARASNRPKMEELLSQMNYEDSEDEADLEIKGEEIGKDCRFRWLMTFDYPLAAVVDKERPQEVMLCHLSKNAPRYVLHLIN